MKKTLLLLLFFSFSTTLIAQHHPHLGFPGGFARVKAMGESPYIEDYDNLKFNAAYAAEFPNFVYGDLGAAQNAGQFAGFNVEAAKHFYIGAMFSNTTLQHVDYITSIAIIDNLPSAEIEHASHDTQFKPAELNNNVSFFAAYAWKYTIIGVGLAYNTTSNNYEAPEGLSTNKTSTASQFGFNAGAVIHLGRKTKLDISTNFIIPSATYELTGVDTSAEFTFSKTLIAVDSRMFFKFSHFELVPLFAVESVSEKLEEAGHDSHDELPSELIVSAGLGFNYYTEYLAFTFGVKMTRESKTYKATETKPEESLVDFAFPIVNLGLEYKFTSWLIGRFGYIAETNTNITKTAINSTDTQERTLTTYHKPGGATLGLGFRFDRFNIDAVMDADIIRKGLGNFSGDHDTFSYISLGCKL